MKVYILSTEYRAVSDDQPQLSKVMLEKNSFDDHTHTIIKRIIMLS